MENNKDNIKKMGKNDNQLQEKVLFIIWIETV